MFAKLLALLLSNVFVSFSVLLYCRSLASKCDLKGENKQWKKLVHVSVINGTRAAIEPKQATLDHICAQA